MKRKEIYHPPELHICWLNSNNLLESLSFPSTVDTGDNGFDSLSDLPYWEED